MLTRLYLGPILVLGLAVAVFCVFAYIMPPRLSASVYFAQFAEGSEKVALVALSLGTGAGFIWALFQTYGLWRWYRGFDSSCTRCGGMVGLKLGRFGQYYRCYACSGSSKY